MIVLSFLLVIVAAVTLIIGLFQDTLAWIWTSIAACVVAMVFLGIGVLQRRGRTTPATADAGYGSSSSGTLVRAGEKVLPGRSQEEDREEVAVVPRTSVRDARPQMDAADTSAVEPTVLPTRTAPSRARSKRDLEEVADAGVASVDDEDIRPVRKAPSRRAAAEKRTPATPERAATPQERSEEPPKPAKKATAKRATKRTAKKATKRTAKKAASTSDRGTSGAAARRKLAEVKGVGPAKQKALLDAFGSLEAIRDASVAELTAIKGIGETTAQELKDALS